MSKVFYFVSAVFLLFVQISLQAQVTYKSEILNKKFRSHELVKINSKAVLQELQRSDRNEVLTLQLTEESKWDLLLEPSGIINENYNAIVAGENAITTIRGFNAIPMKGSLAGVPESKVSLTFNDNFIYGFVKVGFEYYNIEPLYHFDNAAPLDHFVIYSSRDIIEVPNLKCGFEITQEEAIKLQNRVPDSGGRMPGGCYLILYSTASDFSMFQQYGGAAGVQNHNIGVLNDIQTNYDNEFADEIQFQMQQQWISSCSTCDPWTTSTNASTLLSSFRSWAPSNLNQTHNLASLWTRRNLDGSTIGIAYLNALCSNSRYNVLQDFTSNANTKRVLKAHEVGHNFGAGHDASGSNTIMAPSVNSSNTWSSASINAIQSGYLSANCLGTCATTNPPIANFTSNVISECVPGQVQYSDISIGATSRLWSFPGGTPSSSTSATPFVTYNTPGTYGATLTVSGPGGSNTMAVGNIITVQSPPTADFSFSTNTTSGTIFFNYTGVYATAFTWNFGDGGSSFIANPVHTYTQDGQYLVTLTVFNSCGSVTLGQTITISTLPTANFGLTPTQVCQGGEVSFINQSSSNSTTFLWNFPGGTPSSSNIENPVVTYNQPGIYSASLTVFNSAGSHTSTQSSIVTVNPNPVSAFSFTENLGTVNFFNQSQNSTEFVWNFGNGVTNNSVNPSYSYTNSGTYTVTLSASNQCGTSTATQSINISLGPVASFALNSSNPACINDVIQFQNTSGNNPSMIQWYFEGGTPTLSNEANPVVFYANPGTFDVQLIVTNTEGADTLMLEDYMIINTVPEVDFTFNVDVLNVSFNALVQDGENLIWEFGDGQTAIGPNPVHIFASEGAYTVTLNAENSCGNNMYSRVVEVFAIPFAEIFTSGNEICSSDTIHFSAQTNPSVSTWLWNFEGGTPAESNLPNPIVTYNQPGQYNVSLTVSNPAGQTTVVQQQFVTVLSLPTSGYDYALNQNVLSLQNTGTNTDQTTWIIEGNEEEFILVGDSVQLILPENGDYSVIQHNQNVCGTVTLLSQNIIVVNVYPVPVINAPQSSVCAGDAVFFSHNSENGSEYFWSFEGGSPETDSTESPEVIFENAGVYSVTLSVTNAFGTRTSTLENAIIVSGGPEADFEFNITEGVTQFTYTGSPGTFQWNFGDPNSTVQNPNQSTAENPEHIYTRNGIYAVQLIVDNECGSDTISREVQVILSSVADMGKDAAIVLYPNPNNGIFTVFIEAFSGSEAEVLIYDMTGRIIGQSMTFMNQGQLKADMQRQDLLPGAYLVKIKSNGKVWNSRFVVK